MRIEFDPERDEENRRKHGESLADAEHLDLGSAHVLSDDRRAYGEERFRAYGAIDGRLHMLAFTMRGQTVRAISLRQANDREVKRYGRRGRRD